uniref:25-hydroxyvitamin D-1 alpha hydroxylase, mitochondrial n=1 Tax=Gouania willdenowi TaxID=441366 RepID=A0A8C5NCP2_GOUWI
MLQQALRASSRGFPLLRWVERWAEGAAARPGASQVVKTLNDMPGPSFASVTWDLCARQGLSRLHELHMKAVKRYGPVWKASYGPLMTVHVADPALIEQVLRQEGHHPMRSELSSWKDYRKLRGHHYGLLTAEGEEWQTVRSLLGKLMLRPKAVEAYNETLNSIVSDLMAKIHHCRNPQGVVTDIASIFYSFGLEGISSVLFESRIGCLNKVVPEETQHFIESIRTVFEKTIVTMAIPSFLHWLLPKTWRAFCQRWDYIFEFAKGHIDQRLRAEAEKVARGEKVEGHYVTYFLSKTELPMKTVYSNITELLLAGIDTVRISSTMSWSLYELSRHPEFQASLRAEVLAVLEGRKIANAEDIARMPLLKATVKEVLRLYPIIPGNARVITEKDIEVGGYLIPKKTLITLCHFAASRDPAVFKDPDSFQPARWLTKKKSHHPYASLPFGVGKRSCIGRRIAELELYLALSRILVEYDVKPSLEGNTVKPMTRTILVPENVISLQFIER